jgi:hypothetical protein
MFNIRYDLFLFLSATELLSNAADSVDEEAEEKVSTVQWSQII